MDMKWVVGIDEVGRGPLAGPITVGAVLLTGELEVPHFKDSKQLKEADRVRIALEYAHVPHAVFSVSHTVIDERGIAYAARSAVANVLKKLEVVPEEVTLLLDAGLKAPEVFSQTALVKGDEREASIALASIFAKVHRDHLMERYGKAHPGWGFEVHKGYGTKKHREAILKLGLSPIHRRSFCRKITRA